MRRHPYYLFLLFIFAQSSIAAIGVSIDRNPVHVNESFQLIFEADESPDDDPDFSPLQTHFVILNTSQNNSISIIDGDYQRSIKWTLQVIPKQVGDFIVPAIRFGDDKTEPFSVSVKAASQPNGNSNSDLILELTADSETIPVQGQVIISMRLMSNTNITAYQFGDLMIDDKDVVIEPLGDVKRYQTRLGDQAYLVLEKKLALFPQQSGQFRLEPVLGEVRLAPQSSSIFDPFQTRGEIKRVQSPELVLEVTGIDPAFSDQHWLPATELRLHDFWQGDLTKLVAGEPITRTLTLVAEGLTAAQLPTFSQSDVAGIRQYPDQPVLSDQRSETGIIGELQQKIALIPTAGGRYTLPEIAIPWWNVTTQQLEVARIPSRTINVAGNVVDNQPMAEVNSESSQIDAVAPVSEPTQQTNRFWVWLSLFLACGWLGTGLIWWFKSEQSSEISPPQSTEVFGLRAARKQLKQACEVNDAHAAREALLGLAKALNTKFDHINQLADYYGEPLNLHIDALNQSLYSQKSAEWKGEALWQTCQNISAESNPLQDLSENRLSALNP